MYLTMRAVLLEGEVDGRLAQQVLVEGGLCHGRAWKGVEGHGRSWEVLVEGGLHRELGGEIGRAHESSWVD